MQIISRDIGIDMGTANTRVCVKSKGVVLSEPSVVAVEVKTNTVRAIGDEAKEMIGRTPGSIVAVKPLKNGVIADYDVTVAMLKKLIKSGLRGSLVSRARVLISVPAGVTEVESRAIFDAAHQAGARVVDLIESPMAAAIGADLPVWESTGSMVVDIGGGTTEVAVISLGDIVTFQTVRTAGDSFDEAITSYVRKKHNLLIGEITAENVKKQIGSAYDYETDDSEDIEIRGRSMVDGLPKNVTITSSEVREALSEPIGIIVEAIRSTLEKTPPELASDIIDRGILLSGGSALLPGIDKMISDRVSVPVMVADDPINCVSLGLRKRLDLDLPFDTYQSRPKYY